MRALKMTDKASVKTRKGVYNDKLDVPHQYLSRVERGEGGEAVMAVGLLLLARLAWLIVYLPNQATNPLAIACADHNDPKAMENKSRRALALFLPFPAPRALISCTVSHYPPLQGASHLSAL